MSEKKKRGNKKKNLLDHTNDSEDIIELKEAFACFDKDDDGTITWKELGTVMTAMNQHFTSEQLKKIVAQYDENGDGKIDFGEFIQMMNKHERKENDELQEAFATFDTDGDGTISASEIESVFSRIGLKLDKQTISLMIKSVDTDGNGSIDFQEFRKMMKDGPVKLN